MLQFTHLTVGNCGRAFNRLPLGNAFIPSDADVAALPLCPESFDINECTARRIVEPIRRVVFAVPQFEIRSLR